MLHNGSAHHQRLAIRTLRKELESQPQGKGGLILHSDQGSWYIGYLYDNGAMERYFNTLKDECTNL